MAGQLTVTVMAAPLGISVVTPIWTYLTLIVLVPGKFVSMLIWPLEFVTTQLPPRGYIGFEVVPSSIV